MADKDPASGSKDTQSAAARRGGGRRPFRHPSDEEIERAQRGLPMKREPYNPLTANPIPQGALRAFMRVGEQRTSVAAVRFAVLCIVMIIGAVVVL